MEGMVEELEAVDSFAIGIVTRTVEFLGSMAKTTAIVMRMVAELLLPMAEAMVTVKQTVVIVFVTALVAGIAREWEAKVVVNEPSYEVEIEVVVPSVVDQST